MDPVDGELTRMARSFGVLFLVAIGVACSTTPRQTLEVTGEVVLANTPVSTAVNRYFHYRELAVVARDPEILWARYPALRTGEDLQRGINTEGWLAARSYTARSLEDVIYELERYERMRMLRVRDDLVVRVHGLERYIEADFSNGTAGEFILDVHLRSESGEWLVVKTDEMTLSEYHEAAQRR